MFVPPYGKLYLKMQLVLLRNTPLDIPSRRPGPKKPKHRIPPSEWLNVLRRVTENHELLRTIAEDYGVSHETVWRIIHASRKKKAD